MVSDLDRRFDYHKPDEGRAAAHAGVREVIKEAAQELVTLVPEGREHSLMLTKLEEAMFWANAAIARMP